MIIARSPLRISLGGGGTDLPSYYREHEGFLIAAAIDKYVYVTINRPFNEGIYITSGSRITFQNTGLYNIQFSAVVDQGAGKPQLSIWFKKNGLNIDNSNTIASLQANSTALLAWNFAYPFNIGEYVEMWYHTTTPNTTLAYHAAANGFPAAPSLIVTVTQIA